MADLVFGVEPYVEQEEGYVVYAKNYLERIFPISKKRPSPEEYIDTISIFATPGEYEPATFAIYTLKALENIEVKLTDLKDNAGNIIAKDNIDLRVVRWIKKSIDFEHLTDNTLRLPEILQYYRKLNPLAKRSKQYWLIVHVPEDAKSGMYEGTITISPANAETKEVTLQLEVLPIKLYSHPKKVHGMYYHTNRFEEDMSHKELLKIMRLHLVDLKKHGVKAVALRGSHNGPRISIDKNTEEVSVDYSFFIKSLKLLKKMGFKKPLPFKLGYMKNQLEKKIADEEKRDKIYVGIVRKLKDLAENMGIPEILFCPVGEPFLTCKKENGKTTEEKQEELRHYGNLIKTIEGARIYTTVMWNYEEDLIKEAGLDEIIDVRCYHGLTTDRQMVKNGCGFEGLMDEVKESGDEAWMYYNNIVNKLPMDEKKAQFHLESYRLINGFYFWNSPYTRHNPWTYQYFCGKIFDDTDGATSDHAYAYSHRKKGYAPTLPTLKWEAFREGVDDLRYIYTLQIAIQKNKDNPDKQQEVQDAKDFLRMIKDELNDYGPDVEGIREGYDDLDIYQNYRYEIAQLILALQKKKESQDVPPIIKTEVGPRVGISPLKVHFDASSSYDPNGGRLRFLWDFEDGSYSNDAIVSHRFEYEGEGFKTYNVQLEVTNEHGKKKGKTFPISVRGNLPPPPGPQPPAGPPPEPGPPGPQPAVGPPPEPGPPGPQPAVGPPQ